MSVLSCDKVLANAAARDSFVKFATDEFSVENLEFWIEVTKFEAAWASFSNKSAELDRMFQHYLVEGAPKQVCIGADKVQKLHDARRKLESEGPDSDLRTMFSTTGIKHVGFNTQEIALKTLKEDIFPRFEESDAGQKLVATKNFEL